MLVTLEIDSNGDIVKVLSPEIENGELIFPEVDSSVPGNDLKWSDVKVLTFAIGVLTDSASNRAGLQCPPGFLKLIVGGNVCCIPPFP